MTDGPVHHFPPPGAPPPGEPSPDVPQPDAYPAPGTPPASYGAAAAAPPAPAPYSPYPPYPTHGQQPSAAGAGMLGAAHKPGAIPLRPLGLGAMYDGAFRIIRFNPKATVGAAVLVTSVANLIPVIITAVLSLTLGISYEATIESSESAAATVSSSDLVGLLGFLLSILGGVVATWFGLVFVTGMVAHVAHAAALGRRLSLSEAWAATRGKRWQLVGLNAIISFGWLAITALYVLLWVAVIVISADWRVVLLFAVISVPAYLCGMFWYWIRLYYLPAPALMLEPLGVFESIGRGYRLTSRQFWRTFGIALLTWLIVNVASGILTTPISFLGQILMLVFPDAGWLILIIANSVSSVVQYAFVAPFTAAVASLQYVDLRMRKEAYDVDLMREAGLSQQ